jgi:hypothetical protein
MILERGVRPHYVYFLRAHTLKQDAVKIGTTTDPSSRMAALKCDNTKHPTWVREAGARLTLYGWVNGDQELEKALHRAFADYRITGEWFDMTLTRASIDDLLTSWCLCPGCATERTLDLAHI